MAKKKNQHFVPQTYLRSFSNDSKSIGLLIKSSQKIVPMAPIHSQSSRDYFYGKDLLIEDTFSDIEGVLASIINKIHTSGIGSLSPIDIKFLYQYTFLQFGRTEDMVNELVNNASLMKQHFKGIIPGLNAPDFERIDDYQSNVKLGIMVMAEVFHKCKDLRYMFLVNSSKYDFITSDNPVCLYNQFHERIGKRTFAFGSIGAQLFFPLTPRIMLLLYDQ